MLVLSRRDASSGWRAKGSFGTGIDSPVILDSSTARKWDCNILMSAGTSCTQNPLLNPNQNPSINTCEPIDKMIIEDWNKRVMLRRSNKDMKPFN
jgi:hypothetical protein